MLHNYTESETKTKVKIALKSVEAIYKAECCNWKGLTKDTKINYSVVIASELILNLNILYSIGRVSRSNCYFIKNHFPISLSRTNRKEENIAKRLCGLDLKILGNIFDYQIPIKAIQKDKAGKIDLISFNTEENTLYLIELKVSANNDTLLKTCLEIFTYYKQIDDIKLKKEFLQNFKHKEYDNSEMKIKPAVLLSQGCQAHKELKEINNPSRKMLKELIKTLEIDVFSLDLITSKII
jgi:hypothetical protein